MKTVRGNEYKGLLKVGQYVYGIVNNNAGYIRRIDGLQDPSTIRDLGGVVTGGIAWVTIRCYNGVEIKLPEAILRGVQWHIGDVLNEGEREAVDNAYALAKTQKEARETEAEQKRKEQEQTLPQQYPYLETIDSYQKRTGKSYCRLAVAAQNIKTELKRAFPGVKFAVRRKSFSGGDDINISWDDGPTTAQVNEIIGKYAIGSFDGMTDCYNYSHSVFTDLFGGSKYVMTNRNLTIAGVTKAWTEEGGRAEDIVPDERGHWDRWSNPKLGAHIFRAWEQADLRD